MKKIEKIINSEVEKFINENPFKNDRTISGMYNRLKYMSDNASLVTNKINELSNEYLRKYPDTNLNELTNIAKNNIQRYLASPVNN
jgi:hypothetical protein